MQGPAPYVPDYNRDQDREKDADKDKDMDKDVEKKDKSDRNMKEGDGGTGGEGNESDLHKIPEKGGIPIADIRGHLSREGTTSFKFMVRGGRVYHLRAETAEDRDEWIDAIEAWIDYYQ